jgi:pyruvate/2-oxoglutarate dehydrogenase complex dihydrolipoamide acyltransferase (E2) component
MAPVAAGGDRILARLPMQGMRKTIASRMVQSLQEAAQLSSSWESDITDLMAMRKSFIAREEQLGTRVSFNAFLIKAMVYAIRQVPIANSCMVDDEIVIYDNVNMGMAISVPGSTEYDSGLMVAVLHNVERMGVVEIDREMKALIGRARSGEATAGDLSGSTITLSSTAGIAPPGLKTTPVLNLPNAALLGPSTPVERPVVHDGEVAVRTMLPLSFTFDHRMLDGEPAARCMRALHECLEHPELMLA